MILFTQLEYPAKAVSEVKYAFWVSFCFVAFVFWHDRRAIVLAVALSLPEFLCGSQHSPQQLRDTLCHQEMPRSPKKLINPSSSLQQAALTCPPSSEWEKETRKDFLPQLCPGLLRASLNKQREAGKAGKPFPD